MEIAFVNNTTSYYKRVPLLFFCLRTRKTTSDSRDIQHLLRNGILKLKSMSARCKFLVDTENCGVKAFFVVDRID